MATNVSSTTFLSQYNDDYRDSDHFHRVLFNNGRALQARELTHMQTIIQKEVERLAKFVVSEGSIFNNSGTLASGTNATSYTYIKVAALPSGYTALKGTEINYNNIIFAQVKAVLPDNTATETPPGTLIVRLTKADGTSSAIATNPADPYTFTKNTSITTTLGSATILNANDAVGKSSLIETPSFDTYAAGHLITTEAQTLVLDATSNTYSGIVGFKVTEQIITASDNVALYDNSGATPNLTSPGADRLKITLELVKKTDTDIDDIFYEVFKIVNGTVSVLKTPDKTLGRINEIVSARTESITGDFIENKQGGMFDLTVNEDSASTNFLSMEISSGTAFVNGNRIERDYNVPFRVRKPNDATNTQNLNTVSSEIIAAKYGNYFLSSEDSTFGLVSRFADSYGHVNLYDKVNIAASGTVIGEAKVRNLDKFGDDFRTHVFDVQMNSGKSVSEIRSFGIDSDNYANLKAVSGEYGLFDKDENNLLFPLKQERAYAADTVSMVVQKLITGTKSGATTTVTSTTGTTFADTEEWIYSVDSSGALTSPVALTAGGAGSNSATITGVPDGAFTLLAYETYPSASCQRLEKTLTPSDGTWQVDSSLTPVNGVVTFTKTDIFQFNAIYDDATGEDITYKYRFDNGQRDNYYDAGRATLKSGVTAPAGTVWAEYRYFEHDTVPANQIGYFDAQSYVGITYDQIPYFYSNTGKTYRLSDVIDIRPMKNPSTGKFTGGVSRIQRLPRNGDTVTIGTAQYWNPRIDVISLAPNGSLQYHKGVPNTTPSLPTGIPQENMLLHELTFNPFTFNRNDVATYTYDNRGYKMADIRRMDDRLRNVEDFTALTSTEEELAKIQVIDPTTNTIRSTQGLSGDGFFNANQSEIGDADYRGFMGGGLLSSQKYFRAVSLTYDSDLSLNTTVIKGNTIWPVYTEEVADFSQTVATGYENVNQFELAQHVASSLIIPEGDYFTVRRLQDESYTSKYNESLIIPGTNEITTEAKIAISPYRQKPTLSEQHDRYYKPGMQPIKY